MYRVHVEIPITSKALPHPADIMIYFRFRGFFKVRVSSLFFLFFLGMYAYANNSSQYFTLHATPKATARYFIKTGAYRNPSLAHKAVLSSDIPLQIIYMKRYYSLVTQPFKSYEEAAKQLPKIQKRAPDAYIVTLYEPREKVHPLPQKSVKKAPSPLLQRAKRLYDTKQYEEALMLFDRILILEPGQIEAKYYYAAALYHLNLLEESKKNFLQLRKASLSATMRREVDRYLSMIKSMQGKRKVSFSNFIAVGAGYDNNINLNTDKPYTQYGPYRLQNDTNKTKSHYATAELLLTKKRTIGAHTLRATLYSYNELLHSADGNELNFADLQTALLLKRGAWHITLPVGANIAYLGGDLVSYNFYTAPQMRFAMSEGIQLLGNLVLNDNHTAFADNRDYLLFGGGTGIHYQHRSVETQLTTGIYKYDAKENKRYDISKDLYSSTFYLRYTLFARLYLEGKAIYEAHRYSDLDPVLGYKRKDNKSLYKISIGKLFANRHNLTTAYEYTNNDSNINLFSYDKNRYTLTYKYHF